MKIGTTKIQIHILTDVLHMQRVGLKKMEREIENNPDVPVIDVISECAKRTEDEEDTDGITGFMYGCACSILKQCWKYGDDFSIWKEKERNK